MNSTKDRLSVTENNIKVFCRFRPLDSSEQRTRSKFIVNFPANNNGNCIVFGGKLYLFDKVFKPNATQEQVYNEAAKSIVSDVLAGYNGTIFAYGQTSSGKTHTMEGVIGDAHEQGIIPRIGFDIFNHVYGMEETFEFQIKVSYFEIYMNKIRDLLDVSKVNLGVHEDKNGVPFVRGTTERFVSSPEEIYETIQEGRSNRQIAVTSMNEHSSRSHSIFMISIKGKNKKKQKKQSSKLYLVDLAGFEKVSKTGAEGTVLDEAKNINKSLSALRNVISALTDTNKSHIPYRDSVLTRILQESLGGNAKTTIIVCCSPGSFNESETKSALQFGNRVKAITNSASVNEELSMEECERRYKRERKRVAKLKSIIEKLQLELSRWRRGEIIAPEEQVSLDMELDTTIPNTSKLDESNRSMLNIPHNEFVIKLLSNGDRKKLKEERERFYQELNDKNNKINHQLKNLVELEKRVEGQKKLIGSVYQDCEQLQQELNFINRNSESAKDKVMAILQRLDKLTMNDNEKSQDIEIEKKENETMPEISDGEFCTALTEWSDSQVIKSELDKLIEFSHDSEKFDIDCNKMVSEYKTELSEYQLFIPQYNNAPKQIPLTSIEETGTHQYAWKSIETICYSMLQEQPQLIGTEDVFSEITELKETVSRMSVVLEDQMDQLHNSLQRVAVLELEIAEKQKTIDQLKDRNLKSLSAYEQMKADYEQLQQVEAEKSFKLQELIIENERHEETRKDIEELDVRLTKQLQSLHNLRDHIIEHSQITVDDSLFHDNIGTTVNNSGFLFHKQKILFLENNLEQLTKIHIQLMKDNAHFRCELPKLEMKLRASGERIETLEQALRDSKDAAMWERKRYQFIVYNIEEKFKHENSTRRRSCEKITVPDVENSGVIRSNDEGCVIA